MLGLPRRWIRQLTFFLAFLVVAITLLFVANKNSYIDVKSYFPIDFTPSFFQPESEVYLVDVSINNCNKLNSKNLYCGLPAPSHGELGNLYQSGGWSKIDKDISLGKAWLSKQYFAYKEIKSDALGGKISGKPLQEKRDEGKGKGWKDLLSKKKQHQVIVDVAVSNPKEDAQIKGNEKRLLPYYIILKFHKSQIYDDEEHEKLVAVAEKTNGKTTLTKQENEKYEKERIEKENEMATNEDTLASEKLEQDSETEKVDDQQSDDQQSDDKQSDDNSQDKENDQAKDFEENIEPNSPSGDTSSEEGSEISEKRSDSFDIQRRGQETNRHDLIRILYIPTAKELEESGWRKKDHGIWLRYGPPSKDALTGIDLLFGKDAVEPRPNWEFINDGPLTETKSPLPVFLTIRRGKKLDYKSKKFQPTLKFNKDGKFKILQVADLHFSTGVGKCRDPAPESTKEGCEADPRTLKFLETVLDIEKPDFVVLTGDQIFGEASPDSETSVFKALYPFIQREIPFAVTMGNHDDEGSLGREAVMSLSANLPFSMSALGPDEIDGVGNYAVDIEGAKSKKSALTLFFLDTHKYSLKPKVNPGYDWIKSSQITWLEEQAASLLNNVTPNHLSMAFFHIPLPEYRNLDQQFVGKNKEGVTAPKYNSGARKVLGELGVSVASVGHDHCNDYCLQDTIDKEHSTENRMWLCYGGGSGEGGYGGYGGYTRRLRLFEIDSNKGEISSWKRGENDPNAEFDAQILVSNGDVQL